MTFYICFGKWAKPAFRISSKEMRLCLGFIAFCIGCFDVEAIMIDTIKTFTTGREAHRWIPVGERLPETDGYYLTFGKRQNFPYINDFSRDGFDIGVDDHRDCVWWKDDVTHWMELPQPPQAGDAC